MRIALVTPHATAPGPDVPATRGPRMVPLAQAIAELGHEVTIYARKDAPALPAEMTAAPGVRVEHVPAGPARRLNADELGPYVRQFGDQLSRRWRGSAPDVAHAYSWPAGLAALAAGEGLGVPVAQTFHSSGLPAAAAYRSGQRREPLPQVRLKIALARSVQSVLARSSQEVSELARLGVPRTAIQMVPWGVDTAHFGPAGPLASRGSRHRLVAFWPHTAQHGLDMTLQALAELPGTELVIVGGPVRRQLSTTTLYKQVNRLAARLGVADRVSFSGSVTWASLPGVLRAADLFVSSAWEGVFDAAALQAMACATPVAAVAAGFYADAIIDSTTGILVSPGRPGMLARRIRKLLASPLQLEAFGIAAADRARSRYSWDRIARETVAAYGRCVPSAEVADASDTDLDAELSDVDFAGSGLAEALA